MKNIQMVIVVLVTALTLFCLTACADNVAKGDYAPVKISEIGASMDLKGSVRWDKEGKPSFDGEGKIVSFSCWGTNIELKSDQFEDGFISTKDYGKIKVRAN